MIDELEEYNLEAIIAESNRLLQVIGIPERYCKVMLDSLPFRSCKISVGDTAEDCTPDVQRRALRGAVAKPEGQLICIGSTPDDDSAFAAASWIMRQLVVEDGAVKKNVGIVDAAWLGNRGFIDVVTTDQIQNQYKRQHLPSRADGYTIYNVTMGSDATHCQGVRNLLTWYTRPIKVVVVAGCSDPYAFCLGRLYKRPTICCYLRG